MINEIEGDVILVVFGVSLDVLDYGLRVVCIVLEMLDVVETLNMEWDEDGISE